MAGPIELAISLSSVARHSRASLALSQKLLQIATLEVGFRTAYRHETSPSAQVTFSIVQRIPVAASSQDRLLKRTREMEMPSSSTPLTVWANCFASDFVGNDSTLRKPMAKYFTVQRSLNSFAMTSDIFLVRM